MKNPIILMILIVMSITICSCGEPDDPKTNTEIISGKTWLVSSKTVSPDFEKGGIIISDIHVLETEDVKNYTFEFDANGTFTQYDQLGNVLLETTWTFNADETQITLADPIVYSYQIVGDLEIPTFMVESISESAVVGNIPFNYDEVDYVVTIIFSPK